MLRLEFFFLVDTVQYQQRHCGFFCSLSHPGCSVWFWGAMGGKEKSMLLPPCLIQNPHSYVTSAHCHRGKGDYLEANGGLTSERYETFGGAPLRSKWTNLILNGVARDMLIFFCVNYYKQDLRLGLLPDGQNSGYNQEQRKPLSLSFSVLITANFAPLHQRKLILLIWKWTEKFISIFKYSICVLPPNRKLLISLWDNYDL